MSIEPAASAATKANRILGASMLVLGILLGVSFFYAPLEIMVILGGALLMLFGLGAIMYVFVKQLPATATWLGGAAVLLGAIIFVHDLILPPPINTITHGGSALLVIVLAVLAMLSRIDLARRLRRKPRQA